jgi:hypothetical protein
MEMSIILKDISDKRRHKNIPDLEHLDIKGKLNCSKVFHFIHQLDERLKKYLKNKGRKEMIPIGECRKGSPRCLDEGRRII